MTNSLHYNGSGFQKYIRDDWKLYPQPEETMDSFPFPADHNYAGKSYNDLRVCINWEDVSQNVEFEEILGITDDEDLKDQTFVSLSIINFRYYKK